MAAHRQTGHAMAYVTVPDRTTARKISRAVLEQRLAACANFWPAESIYRWRGSRQETREFVIVFKTRKSLLKKLIAAVRRLHPYDVPCIVTYPMGPALPEYLAWIDAETA